MLHSGSIFDLETKEHEVAELQAKTNEDGFWNDNTAAQKVIQRINEKKNWIDSWKDLNRLAGDAAALIELAEESQEAGMGPEILRDIEKLEQDAESVELRNMLSGPDDEKNALLTIHAGAGGTEAQDW